jgi:hypothetical protein
VTGARRVPRCQQARRAGTEHGDHEAAGGAWALAPGSAAA